MGKKEYLVFIGLAFELAALVVSFIYAGHYIDQKMGYSGPGVASGAVIAIIIWITHLMRAFKNIK